MAKGRPLPEWYVNEPQVPPAEEFYLRAFNELVTGRNSDGRIPWRDIEDYADRCGLDAEVVPAFRHIIRALERTFSLWLQEERERQQGRGTPRGAREEARQRAPR